MMKNVNNNILSLENQLLILSSNLLPSSSDFIQIDILIKKAIDWDKFVSQAIETFLAPIIYRNLKKLPANSIPNEAMQSLKNYQHQVLLHNIQLFKDCEELVSVLNKNAIDFIPLKGIFLAEVIYQNIALRHISDIDLLTKSDDVERCKNALLESGWSLLKVHQKSETVTTLVNSPHPYSFIKGNTIIELHKTIHSGLYSYHVEIADYWERSIASKYLNGEAYFLNPSDLIQHICLHLIKHLYSTVKLSAFRDLTAVINHYQAELNWDLLKNTSIKYKCFKEVQGILFLTKKYWNGNVPEIILLNYDKQTVAELEIIFLQFITGKKSDLNLAVEKRAVPTLNSIHHITGYKNKFRFLFSNFFPSKQFMINRYKIRFRFMVYFYYPLRAVIGLTKTIRFVFYKTITFLKNK